MKKNDIPPAFMPAPGHCEKESRRTIGNVTVIDTVICHWYCTTTCPEYLGFHESQVEANRERRKRRKFLEADERPELEL